MPSSDRRLVIASVALVAGLAIVVPVLGAARSAADPTVVAQAPSEKPAKSKAPEVSVTVTGVVKQTADDKGRPTFSMTAGGTTWELSAGPSWYWGDKNPLAASAGKSVTVAGTHREGSTELDVETVDGAALREPGKPPWAGGPFVVGESHPGWKPWMADGKPGKGHGRENAPGQLKDKTQTEGD